MDKLKIAVVGSGVSGLSAAWLLSKHHDVTVFEADGRIGGHANTVAVSTKTGSLNVDTGFIVFNKPNYPNFCALLSHLGVAWEETEMSFSVSLGDGAYEYSGSGFSGFFGQKRNLVLPRHWQLLLDISRFFQSAERLSADMHDDVTLGEFLDYQRYSRGFVDDHILPMAAAIWSAKKADMLNFPARSFITFYANHGLLQFRNRPPWCTVKGGSRSYIDALCTDSAFKVRTNSPIQSMARHDTHVVLSGADRVSWVFDAVVIATHGDQALQVLSDKSEDEARLLSRFSYQTNRAVLHRDIALMPKRKSTWASWNYVQDNSGGAHPLSVTYWMNRLQTLETEDQLFVTLNPTRSINPDLIDGEFYYEHPLFDVPARQAQTELWQLQGRRRTWFCGSYFGSGFHEDGVQAGLAVAEALGGVRRPWRVKEESSRIHVVADRDGSEPKAAE